MTSYTTSLRLWQGTPGDPAIKNAWGTPLNTNDSLIEAAILGTAAVNIAGLTTYSLTVANGASDQSRPQIQSYTGALAAGCTVTLPNVAKLGLAVNNTTGGFNVILTAGAGTTVTIPPDGYYYQYLCDGSTNIVFVGQAFANVKSAGNVAATGNITAGGTLGVTGAAQFGGAGFFAGAVDLAAHKLTSLAAGTVSTDAVNFGQFGTSVTTNPTSFTLPNGLIINMGTGITDGTGLLAVTFDTPFVSLFLGANCNVSFDGPSSIYSTTGNQTKTTGRFWASAGGVGLASTALNWIAWGR